MSRLNFLSSFKKIAQIQKKNSFFKIDIFLNGWEMPQYESYKLWRKISFFEEIKIKEYYIASR